MSKLFGVPIGSVLLALVAVFLVLGLGLSVSALRNRVAFRMAVRNIPRRKAQTALILLGLMLATLLFSASFATGDTLTGSLRRQAVGDLGEVDMTLQVEERDMFGALPYFPAESVTAVTSALAGRDDVDGVTPYVHETAPVFAPDSSLSEPSTSLMGLAPGRDEAFGALLDETGTELELSALADDQVYASAEAAESLDAGVGDRVQVYLGPTPVDMTVAGVFVSGAEPAGDSVLVLPVDRLATLTGHPGQVNRIGVSLRGAGPGAAEHSAAVVEALEPVLPGLGLEATPVKQDRLDEAEQLGSFFSSIFLLFAQFSVGAGILLIFLIFVMLAAERKHELGMARAVGAQRGHVVRMFVYEGVIYALLASAVGSVLGVIVGWGMVRMLRAAISSEDFALGFVFNWRSVAIAYLLGTVFTFIVVLASSWRVSRLNIVRAVRDLPEPRIPSRSRRRLALYIGTVALGVVSIVGGLQTLRFGLLALGVSLVIIGLALVARRAGLSERAAFTVAGALLIAWWILPGSVTGRFLPEMEQGIELFFISGVMLVIGGVWVVIFNTDLIMRAVVAVFGRIRGLPPVLKTAVTYPSQERFRTGMTLAMVALVVFTLVVMSFINTSIASLWEDTSRFSGGYDLRAAAAYANPVRDLAGEFAAKASTGEGLAPAALTADDLTTVAVTTGTVGKAAQVGAGAEPAEVYLQGVDDVYSETTAYDLLSKAPGYASARDVWRALQNEPDTAVVNAFLVPTKSDFSFSSASPPFTFEGFWLQDEVLPEVYVSVAGLEGGEPRRLRVIGVLDSQAVYAGHIVTSRATLDAVAGRALAPAQIMVSLREGVDPAEAARSLERAFVANGLQVEPVEAEVRSFARSSLMVNTLMQGFMALGLVVGIAALGVIAARAVVERRRQIGVLRALGFQREMVQFSFLLESSFVALLGIGIGTALAVGLSPGIVESFQEQFEGMRYQVPVGQILLIAGVAYAASLLTTFLPSRQAARVYPAEALRYE